MANLTEEQFIKRDRLRYTKNTASANLALLAIVFDVLFFVSIYKSNMGNYYYTLMMGISVVYNLIFMLAAFLVSEGSKNYLVQYSYLMIAIGLGQFIRIFLIPMHAHSAMIDIGDNNMVFVMGDAQFTRVVFYLAASGICCLASAVIGIIKCGQLKSHLSTLVEKTNSEITS